MVCITIPNNVVAFLQVLGILIFFSIITAVITVVGFREQIANHWEKYRCNPIFAVFADFFGHSPKESLDKCMFNIFKKSHSTSISPFIDLMASVSKSLGSAGDMMTQMDGVLDGVTNMFSKGFSDILNQIGNTASVIQYLIIKMEIILQRLAATLVVMMYTLSSSLQGVLAIKRDPVLLKAVDTLIKFPSF